MSGWKRLNQQDVYVTTYTAKKSWSISGTSDFLSHGVEVYDAQSGSSFEYYLNSSDLFSGNASGNEEYSYLVWRSLHQLYYSNYDRTTGGIITSGSFDNYEESSLVTGSRFLLDRASVISIPRELVGTNIEPRSYSQFVGSTNYLYDDGEGYLRYNDRDTGDIRGIINYSHGLIIVSKNHVNTTRNNPARALSWKSNHTIYTHHFNCKASDFEFNSTLNRTSHKDQYGNAKDFVTGSDFQPYITTVGLYNDANELVAVGKLSKPLPKSKHVETVIKVRLDM